MGLCYRAATRPADYSFQHVQSPLGSYWRAKSARLDTCYTCLLQYIAGSHSGNICHPPSPILSSAGYPHFLAVLTLVATFLLCTAVTSYLDNCQRLQRYSLSCHVCHESFPRPNIVATNKRLPVQQHPASIFSTNLH
ncbi:hypothetical protein IQ07DRAFT_370987 [Pyrenochaeta sp. DS3sAY3a]|nr:hypothetical protein IQ07DRAFT_370987 [Pyrenochaeta sp. DS3sAY3a]